MLRSAGSVAMLLLMAACATVTRGAHLSPSDVQRLADAEVTRRADLRQYEVSGIHYIPNGNYWSVTYRSKTDDRIRLKVRVSDQTGKASADRSDTGIFEGSLTEKSDYH